MPGPSSASVTSTRPRPLIPASFWVVVIVTVVVMLVEGAPSGVQPQRHLRRRWLSVDREEEEEATIPPSGNVTQ